MLDSNLTYRDDFPSNGNGSYIGFIIGLLICLLISICSCSSSKKIIDENQGMDISIVTNDSISIDSVVSFGSSVITTIDTNIETEQVVIEYSAPDSLGNQYIVKQTTTRTKQANKSVEERNDSLRSNTSSIQIKNHNEGVKVYKQKTTTKEKKGSFGTWQIYLGLIIAILFIFIIIKFVKLGR